VQQIQVQPIPVQQSNFQQNQLQQIQVQPTPVQRRFL
jgi:hypothetical protein